MALTGVKPNGGAFRLSISVSGGFMRLLALGAIVGCAALAPQVVCQDQTTDQKHLAARMKSASVHFAADSIFREDPPTQRPSPYASVVRLRGNVQIKTCCIQVPSNSRKGNASEIPPMQAVLMHADEADFHQDTGEIEVRGNVRVSLQDYPK